jgi:hypothetical protein
VSAKKIRKPACLRDLEKSNPQVMLAEGTSHWKIVVNGILVGIYPRKPRTEGFADNTRSQLRRAGLVVGER